MPGLPTKTVFSRGGKLGLTEERGMNENDLEGKHKRRRKKENVKP